MEASHEIYFDPEVEPHEVDDSKSSNSDVVELRPRLTDEQLSLVDGNIGLVVHIAKKFQGRGIDLEDLVQEGAIGLIEAASRYSPGVGAPFSSFAKHRIAGAIGDAIRVDNPLSRSQQAWAKKYDETNTELTRSLQRAPTVDEIAEKLDITAEEAREVLVTLGDQRPISIYDIARSRTRGRHEERFTLQEIFADPMLPDEDRLVDGAVHNQRMRVIYDRLLCISDKERRTLWGLRDGFNSREIGEQLGVTESRICQLKGKLFTKIIEEFNKDENQHLIP